MVGSIQADDVSFKLSDKEERCLGELLCVAIAGGYIPAGSAASIPTFSPNNYNSKHLYYNELLFLKRFMITPQ